LSRDAVIAARRGQETPPYIKHKTLHHEGVSRPLLVPHQVLKCCFAEVVVVSGV
jgi:hypothetical protein